MLEAIVHVSTIKMVSISIKKKKIVFAWNKRTLKTPYKYKGIQILQTILAYRTYFGTFLDVIVFLSVYESEERLLS